MNKLYTEEQMKEAIKNGYLHFFDDTNRLNLLAEEYMNSLTPIELPTDEEIEEYINSFPYTKHLDDGQYNDGVMVGVELGIEWFKNKIKGGNK